MWHLFTIPYPPRKVNTEIAEFALFSQMWYSVRMKQNAVGQRKNERKGGSAARFLAGLILLALAAGLCVLFHAVPSLFFPGYRIFSANLLAALSRLVSFARIAVWDVVLVLLAVWLIASFVRMIVKRKPFLGWCSGVFLTAAVLAFWFVGVWGLNHYAPPLSESIGLDVRLYSENELAETAEYLRNEAAALADDVPRNGDGTLAPQDFYELARIAGASYERVPAIGWSRTSAPVKKLALYGPILVRTGSIGIFMPITAESSVPADCATEDMPYTMAHEAAHRLAVASEQEANFCAFLACEASEDVRFRYSGFFSAFVYCYNALYRVDPDRARALFSDEALPGLDAVRLDLRTRSAYYRQFEGPAEDFGNRVNDTYLKAFSQTGLQSYGEVVDYLIAWKLAR